MDKDQWHNRLVSSQWDCGLVWWVHSTPSRITWLTVVHWVRLFHISMLKILPTVPSSNANKCMDERLKWYDHTCDSSTHFTTLPPHNEDAANSDLGSLLGEGLGWGSHLAASLPTTPLNWKRSIVELFSCSRSHFCDDVCGWGCMGVKWNCKAAA